MKVELNRKIIPEEWLGHFNMLRDTHRNMAYYTGVENFSTHRKISNCAESDMCVDIGCGSGLLGCLVAKYYGCKVIAFECISLLAAIARETVLNNGLQNLVQVVLTHTSDLDEGFMMRSFGKRSTFAISELLDTGFLGEGLIEGMAHAKKCLLNDVGSISIPEKGRVFIQGWCGESMRNRHALDSHIYSLLHLKIPESSQTCCGGPASTIHFSPLLRHGTSFPITPPTEIFSFDFMNLQSHGTKLAQLDVLHGSGQEGSLDALVLWWECDTFVPPPKQGYGDHNCTMTTCALREDYSTTHCDHWRQGVFFQASDVRCEKSGVGDCTRTPCRSGSLPVLACHNEDDVWVRVGGGMRAGGGTGLGQSDVSESAPQSDVVSRKRKCSDPSEGAGGGQLEEEWPPPPWCSCGLHSSNDCFRIREMNSSIYLGFLRFAMQYAESWVVENMSLSSLSCLNSGVENPVTMTMTMTVVCVGDSVVLPAAIKSSLLRPRHAYADSPRYASTTLLALMSSQDCISFARSMSQENSFTDDNEHDEGDSSGVHVRCPQGLGKGEGQGQGLGLLKVREIFLNSEGYSACDESSLDDADCGNGDVRDTRAERSDWLQDMKQTIVACEGVVQGGVETGTASRGVSLLLGEPYFKGLADQWTFEHLSLFHQLSATIEYEMVHALRSKHSSMRYVGKLYCCLFTCPLLYEQYCSPISDVCGIDMRAINRLLSAVPVRCLGGLDYSQVNSVRYSQWADAEALPQATFVGRVAFPPERGGGDGHGDVCGEDCLWKQSATLPLSLFTGRAGIGDACHGVLLWMDVAEADTDREISSGNPAKNPDSLQAFRCFQVPINLTGKREGDSASDSASSLCSLRECVTVHVAVASDFTFLVAVE